MRTAWCWLILCLLLMAGASVTAGTTESPAPEYGPSVVVRGTTDKSFDSVIQELEFAITEHNYRITGRNTLGKALRERGYEGFPDVEVILFCNVEQAREVLAVDPGFVAMMPCRATVHEQNGQRVVSMVLLPESHAHPEVVAFAQRVNRVLKDILAFVLEQPVP
ncbi:MAG: hypothetical protein RL434_655 [Pseudomonadota bacterium]